MTAEETKVKIVISASELFMEQGCKRVTMDNIANSMHISKRTLYEFFNNKEELLTECLRHIQQKIQETRRELESKVDEPLLLALFLLRNAAMSNLCNAKLISDAEHYYPEIYAQFFKLHTEEFSNTITSVLRDAMAKGIILESVDIDVAVKVIVAFTNHHTLCAKNDYEQWTHIISETCYTYLRGMLSPKAAQTYDEQETYYKELLKHKKTDITATK